MKRLLLLQDLLRFIGLEGRLRLEWISSAEGQKFARVITTFTEHIQTLGPSPIRIRGRDLERGEPEEGKPEGRRVFEAGLMGTRQPVAKAVGGA